MRFLAMTEHLDVSITKKRDQGHAGHKAANMGPPGDSTAAIITRRIKKLQADPDTKNPQGPDFNGINQEPKPQQQRYTGMRIEQ